MKVPRVFKYMKPDEYQRPSIAVNLSAICRLNKISDKVINDGVEMVLQELKYIYTTLSFAAKFLKPFSLELAGVIIKV
jgi:hypothetical protein